MLNDGFVFALFFFVFCLFLSFVFFCLLPPPDGFAFVVESEQFDVGTKDDCAGCVWGVE